MLTTEPHAEAAAFAKLAARHRGPLLAYCARLVGQDHAEDVLQQTMLKAWLAIEKQGVDVESPRAWLFRIAHNQAMDHLRKAGTPWDELDCEWESPESTERAYEALDRLGRVSDGIKGLPVRQRDALLMHSLSGDSYADIATKMNTNVPVISQLITRARARLREIPAVLPPLLLLRRLTGAARRATAGLSTTTKAAVVASVVATGAGVPLVVDHGDRAAPGPKGASVAAGGQAAPMSAASRRHSATHHRAKPSRKHGARPALGTVADTVTQHLPAGTATDYRTSTTLAPQRSGAASPAYGGRGADVNAGTNHGPPAGPVSSGASVSVPGVATVGAVSQVTADASLHLPAAVSVPRPPLP
jgi:RNA polymerase sigma factor (sigma-70 family)